ncbi:hypothetical protein [Chryseobacterium caseinilyticum]|uniref:Lipoprotein n=1 Tax=Chryseobacterium caseinilyticum TaxID=2771428 RepID=A0ABR8ZFK0_9FLAO|nr:hypothetical protein [Chryseobacterium caseinilyticum]MBD8084022.1 hypothetical protein [Chryseobacterium caseinilyticum]
MQKNIYLIALLFSLVSCYTYQVKKPVELPVQGDEQAKRRAANSEATPVQMADGTAEMQAQRQQPGSAPAQPLPVNIQEKLAVGKNYRINVGGSSYKIIVDKWQGDSLVAHPVKRPETILKFHKDQIDSEKIAEKRFSQPIADIITVVAYVGIGVGIYAFIKGM